MAGSILVLLNLVAPSRCGLMLYMQYMHECGPARSGGQSGAKRDVTF